MKKKQNPDSKTETIGVKVSPSTRKRLETIAKRKDRKISYVVNQIIENYFDKVA